LSLSVNTAWASVDYKFEAVSPPSGTTLTVRLVDPATGQPVTAAHVYVIHRQWLPMKSALRFIDRRIALTPNSDGTFTYESNDVQAGSTIQLGAEVGLCSRHWVSNGRRSRQRPPVPFPHGWIEWFETP
jgi:hypothetical protein